VSGAMASELNIPASDVGLIPRMLGRVRPITTGEASIDEAAFSVFYEATSRPLFAYLLRVSGARDVAEDLLQDSYSRLLSVKFLPADPGGKRSYLFRIATNLLRDRWRRHKQESLPEPVPEIASPGSDPDLRIDIREAFQRLKGRERQLLWLAYVEGSSHKEIAKATGLKSASVRLLLFRARCKLATLIGRSPRS